MFAKIIRSNISFIVLFILLTAIAPSSLSAPVIKEYSGSLGRKVPDYVGTFYIPSHYRFLQDEKRSTIVVCADLNSHDVAFFGVAEDIDAGGTHINAPIKDIEGKYAGRISLHRKSNDSDDFDWEGSINGATDWKVRMSGGSPEQSALAVRDYGLTITDNFGKDIRYVPREIFMNARPRINNYKEAFSLFDKHFPNWRKDIYGCNRLSGHFKIDYEQTDISMLSKYLKEMNESGFFDYAEIGIAEYGGLPEQVWFPISLYPFDSYRTFVRELDKLANIIAKEVMCNGKCDPTAMSAKGSNVRIFEIVGPSQDMHFRKDKHFEKYIISMTGYTGYRWDDQSPDGFYILFQIVSGFMAPSGNGEIPSLRRFEENPIDDYQLNDLSSKLQQAVSRSLGGEYQGEM